MPHAACHMSHCALRCYPSCSGNNERKLQAVVAAVIVAAVVVAFRVSFEACAKFMRTICEIYCNDKRLAHNSPRSEAVLRRSRGASSQFEPEAGNQTAVVVCLLLLLLLLLPAAAPNCRPPAQLKLKTRWPLTLGLRTGSSIRTG